MEDKFKIIEDQDSAVCLTLNSVTLKMSRFLSLSKSFLQSQGFKGIHKFLVDNAQGHLPGNSTLWTQQGVDCEILSPNSLTWKKGKVRMKIVLEFCPDEPENEETENPDSDSLDDIRKTL